MIKIVYQLNAEKNSSPILKGIYCSYLSARSLRFRGGGGVGVGGVGTGPGAIKWYSCVSIELFAQINV